VSGSTPPTNVSTLDLLVARHHCFRAPSTGLSRRRQAVTQGPPKGNSSTGRASVSKTEGCGFESLLPCGVAVIGVSAVEKRVDQRATGRSVEPEG
jgi:hypothetical protein